MYNTFGYSLQPPVLNEWKDYRKEGNPLFTVNSKTGDLKILSSGTGVCSRFDFIFQKDGKEIIKYATKKPMQEFM